MKPVNLSHGKPYNSVGGMGVGWLILPYMAMVDAPLTIYYT